MPNVSPHLFLTLYLSLTIVLSIGLWVTSPWEWPYLQRRALILFPFSVFSPMNLILLFLHALMGQVLHHHPWTPTINYLAKITNLTNCRVCPKDLWAPDDLTYKALPLAIETLLYNITSRCTYTLSWRWHNLPLP
jgi:hypothetical protein